MFANSDIWFVLGVVFMIGFFLGLWLRGKSISNDQKRLLDSYSSLNTEQKKKARDKVNHYARTGNWSDEEPIRLTGLDPFGSPFPTQNPSPVLGRRPRPGNWKQPPIIGDKRPDE